MKSALTFARADRDRLIKLVGMLGSDNAAERAVAALKATQMIEGVGATWAELVGSLPVKPALRFHTRLETRIAAARMGLSV